MSIQIDLAGPEGDAFYLMGLAKKLSRSVAMTDNELDAIIEKMRAKDYNHLLDTLVESFPGFDFEFENDPRSPQ